MSSRGREHPSVRAHREKQDLLRALKAREASSDPDRRITEDEYRTPGYQQWRDTLPQAMAEPVISAQGAADMMNMMVPNLNASADEVREVLGDYASMHDVLTVSLRTQAMHAGVDIDAPGFDDRVEARIGGVQDAIATGHGNPADLQIGSAMMGLVAAHGPDGPYAAYHGRDEAQQSEARQQYGKDAEFHLTPGGEQNHRALRVHEFLSAPRADYAPSATSSRFLAAVGGPMATVNKAVRGLPLTNTDPSQGRVGSNVFDGWNQFEQTGRTGGKYEHAMEMWRRSDPRFDTESSRIYNNLGQPKFDRYNMFTYPGVGQGMMNASYPLGAGGNYLRNNKQWGVFFGNAAQNGLSDARDEAEAATRVRMNWNRVTPTQIPGLTQEQFVQAGRALEEFDSGSDSFASAMYGPPMSRAWNTVTGQGNAGDPTLTRTNERGEWTWGESKGAPVTYLSNVSDGAVNMGGELLADPTNWALNFGLPVAGAAMGGAKGWASSAGKSMLNRVGQATRSAAGGYALGAAGRAMQFGDDIMEEGVGEGALFGLADPAGMFGGQPYNALMGDMQAKDVTPGKVMDRFTDVTAKRFQATKPLKDLISDSRPEPTDEPPTRYGPLRRMY